MPHSISSTKKQLGFTLIELLVVLAIIGVLAGISMQILTKMRGKAFDSRAMQDLRNVAMAEESYFATFEVFKNCSNAACVSVLPGIEALSAGVTLTITSSATGFIGTAQHPNGTGKIYSWNSSNGGLQ